MNMRDYLSKDYVNVWQWGSNDVNKSKYEELSEKMTESKEM